MAFLRIMSQDVRLIRWIRLLPILKREMSESGLRKVDLLGEFETESIVSDYFRDTFEGKQISYRKRLESIQKAHLCMFCMQMMIK